ncbi:MAG: hypothetical protein ACR2PM_02045 [Hyphomicrobiales bacterium]
MDFLRTPPFPWTCGYCGTVSNVPANAYHSGYTHLDVGETAVGNVALVYAALRCPNAGCRELTLAVRLADYKPSLGHAYPIGTAGETIAEWTLLPAPDPVDPETGGEPS